MTSDLQPMYALTFGSVLILSYHFQPIGLYWIIFLFYYIIISRLPLYHYLHQVLGSTLDIQPIAQNPIAIGWYRYRLELLHRLVNRSAVLSIVYISCRLQDQTDWHARISSRFGPALELSRSPRSVCIFSINSMVQQIELRLNPPLDPRHHNHLQLKE